AMVADGDISLNSALWAGDGDISYVYLYADGNIVGTKNSLIRANQLDMQATGAIALGNSVHQVSLLDATAQSGLEFINGQSLWISHAGVGGDGNILIRTVDGDLALLPLYSFKAMAPAPDGVRIEGKGDIDLVSAGAFINGMGADAIYANDGDWRVWAQDPAQSKLGGLQYDFKHYNAHDGASAVLGQGNGVLYTLAPLLDVGLRGTAAKTYDGTDLARLDASNYVIEGGLQAGDRVLFSRPAQGRYSDKNA